MSHGEDSCSNFLQPSLWFWWWDAWVGLVKTNSISPLSRAAALIFLRGDMQAADDCFKRSYCPLLGVSKLLLTKQRQQTNRHELKHKRMRKRGLPMQHHISTHLFQHLVYTWVVGISGLKKARLSMRAFQAKRVQCFTSLSLYNQLSCYLFYWQALGLLACQRKGKTAVQQSWKPLLGRRRGRKDALKQNWMSCFWLEDLRTI